MVEPVQNISLEGVHTIADIRRRLSLLQKVLGETLPALPFLEQSTRQCLVLCVADTAIIVVLSAGEQNMQSGYARAAPEGFNADLLCLRPNVDEAAEIA